MNCYASRRVFLKASTLASAGYWAAAGATPHVSASPNERLAFAGIGIGGKGESDIANAARFADVVAICDTDGDRLSLAKERYPKAKKYTDFRKLLDENEKTIDVATVSTTDHTHAVIALMAMRMKKHVYVQKPLARTIYEARLMGQVAKETGVCTQMGNQQSASDRLRRHAAELKAGVYGDIQEIHVWTNRPVWLQGPSLVRNIRDYEAGLTENVASQLQAMQYRIKKELGNLDWESWIGPARMREYYADIYHPFAWRGWWEFGTGALGDIACHSLNAYMAALDLSAPRSVVAKTSGHDFDAFPRASRIEFEYEATASRPGFKFVWYDGGWKPDREFITSRGFNYGDRLPDSGDIVIGSAGCRGLGRIETKSGVDVGEIRYAPFYSQRNDSAVTGREDDPRNMFELVTAIRENKPELCFSNFPRQAGPLTEAMLLGNLAVWTASQPDQWGEKIFWDATGMKITNLADLKTPGVSDLIKPVYRSGYTLDT